MGGEDGRVPIIVIGMHRSGTSLVTQMLEELGLFVGARKDENYEARFFVQFNRWIIRQSGGAWDHPESVRWLLADTELRPLVVEYLQRMLDSPRAMLFLGLARYARYRGLCGLSEPWGWKDPRTTWTLPIWLNLFPGAKVLHVLRNGIDVAESLRRRRRASLPGTLARYRRFRAIYWLHPKRGGVTESVRCGTLEGAFSLWESYTMEARRSISALDNTAMEIRFEDLMSDPVRRLTELAEFCGLYPEPGIRDRVAAQVCTTRAFGYRADGDLRRFADGVRTRLNRLGYEP
jgi:hypothetical protein